MYPGRQLVKHTGKVYLEESKTPKENARMARGLYVTEYATDYCERASQMVSNIKSRAKKKGIPFDLDYNWYVDRVERGVCEVTGVPFVLPVYTGKKGNKCPWVPSVDRKDPNKGYTKDNCQVVVHMYNLMKNQWTHQELVKFCRAVLLAEAFKARSNLG